MSTRSKRPEFNMMRGGVPDGENDLDFAPVRQLGDPEPGPERAPGQAQRPPVPSLTPGTSQVVEPPLASPPPSAGSLSDEDLLAALARAYPKDKFTVYVPAAATHRVFEVAVAAGRQLGRKKIPEYLVILAALMSLPDPDDAEAIREMLERVASALPRVAAGEI